ncbi:MAG: Fe-S cluster assembly ATPase SufC [Candidatus Magasanikbacteria bacterium]|nr:Fe-S cluster assembly ATPase SufC [Candidatus Magasanikbacteria bacterium]
MQLEIKNLKVEVEGREVLKGINLEIKAGEVHAIMGPNGSGKSTLSLVLAGHPKYKITEGDILVDGKSIKTLTPDKRAKLGLFLSMQNSPEVGGVTITNFLRMAKSSLTGVAQNPIKFYRSLLEKMKDLNMDPAFASRYLNVGFSGGEKKKAEVLQLAVLNPKFAILDETDSGLDVDALKIVSNGINKFHNKENSVLLITHYNRILEYVKPDFVHVLMGGKIIKSGERKLAKEVEKEGYKKYDK